MDGLGHTSALASNYQGVAGLNSKIGVGPIPPRGQQHQPSLMALPELDPRLMPPDVGAFEIIHAGPAEIPVRQQKSTGLDYIDPYPETGAQPHQAARILRDIGLI